jgi:nucleoside-diphosphate-sugar epimerase
MKCAVIFGGTGFIGSFFAKYLLDNDCFGKVYLVDIESSFSKKSKFRTRELESDTRIEFVSIDVKLLNENFRPPEDIILIANFAAIHREPGHEISEYFDTNILGAENVCKWANFVGCKDIIFTSSIAPYGPSEVAKLEVSTPTPTTAYGSSKLAAEKIHCIWQATDRKNRNLTIVRPGVVFGPGEGGNVSRLIKAIIGRYFVYMGNRKTRKAGIYVKELCHAMWWISEQQKNNGQGMVLFNMSMNSAPTIEEYVNVVCEVSEIKRFIPNLPFFIVISLSYFITFILAIFSLEHAFKPTRIRKLVRSNNIIPGVLADYGYTYKYTLVEAFQDWKKCCPEEW